MYTRICIFVQKREKPNDPVICYEQTLQQQGGKKAPFKLGSGRAAICRDRLFCGKWLLDSESIKV